MVWQVLRRWMAKLAVAVTPRPPINNEDAEDVLKLSEARYQAVVESQTALICRSLPDGTLTFVNEATAAILVAPMMRCWPTASSQ